MDRPKIDDNIKYLRLLSYMFYLLFPWLILYKEYEAVSIANINSIAKLEVYAKAKE